MTLHYDPVSITEPRTGCRPGAKALITYTRSVGFSDKGCFNPNSRIPGGGPSFHTVGRAVDLWWGDGVWITFDDYIGALVDHAGPLGIQQVLWNGDGWSYQRPYWHPLNLTITAKHDDHAHIDLTIDAAEHLTVRRIGEILLPPPPEPPAPILVPASIPTMEIDMPYLILRGPGGNDPWFAIYSSGLARHIGGDEAGWYVTGANSVPVVIENDAAAYLELQRFSGYLDLNPPPVD